MRKKRWMEVSEGSDEKQEALFDKYIAGAGIPFINEQAKTDYQERATLVKDAVQMKKVPNRVAICVSGGTFPLEYAGISWKEAMYHPELVIDACAKYAEDFPADFVDIGAGVTPGKVFDILDFKLCIWAGHGLEDNKAFQYIEKDYLKADEYQDLIDDPTGWFLNVFFPRIFGGLEGFKDFPMLAAIHEMPLVPAFTFPFSNQPLSTAMENLQQAAKATQDWSKVFQQATVSKMSQGFPLFEGSGTKAPFDALGDTLRGTKEIMMDLFRRPEMVIEACERLTPLMVKFGVRGCLQDGNPMCFIPLHKGADGFMTEEQFLTFYWPTLRQLIIGLIDQGVVPLLFAEGSYNSRLEIIADDIPEGKVIWYFDQTDMERAKATVGQKSCIMGNVPIDILYAGTPEEVSAYCKTLIQVAGQGGGYIFSTGAGMQGVKVENIKAMLDTAKEYGVY
jgi:uroporphyrinogen-III decarboxylase